MAHRVIGAVQHYDWGHPSYIPRLFRQEPDGTPWAEMWFGTHVMAPSHLESGAALSSVAGDMTMLVKVLACTSPLSLQTHPTRAQAESGFAREETAGIALSDPKRTYKDMSDKPEMIIALTPFEALCGFDSVTASVGRLKKYGWHDEAEQLQTHGIKKYMQWAFAQKQLPSLAEVPDWLSHIESLYPNDPAIRVAPLLNHVSLNPGQVLSLPAGNLHAYLNGAGLEVMASSDNVVRAGFTTKHIDVSELLAVVDATPLAEPIVIPMIDEEWTHYTSPSPAFDVASFGWVNQAVIPPSPHSRMIFGTTDANAPQPHMMYVPAGESLTVTGPPKARCVSWVFTQN